MSYTISKQYTFSASHQLHGLEEGHPCGRLHGHNYTVEIQLTGEALDEHGFIVDYNVMDQRIGEWIASVLDHRDLNTDVPNIGQPTAENLAEFIWSMVDEKFRDVEICVRVAETPKTWAQYPGW